MGFAFHGGSGEVSATALGKVRRAYGCRFGKGDAIGALLQLRPHPRVGDTHCKIRFYVNGRDLGVAFNERFACARGGAARYAWRPAVGVHSHGVDVRVQAAALPVQYADDVHGETQQRDD